jgi:hypothetical protein
MALEDSDNEDPLCLVNPFAQILMEGTDDWALNDLSFNAELPPPPSTPITKTTCLPSICSSTDMDVLRRRAQTPVTEPLAARPLAHLGWWRATSGGDEFMKRGVQGYWIDPIESPRRLRAVKGGKQRIFPPTQEAEFYKLLQNDLDQGIVQEVPNNSSAYTSPVRTVPKKGNEWRIVWDGRVVNDGRAPRGCNT